MMCPDCDGGGRIRKRFLLFFTRRARCRKCLGTGEFPPPVTRPGRAAMPLPDDDRDMWTTRSSDHTIDRQPPSRGDSLQVGSGGRSGGGGGGASWDEAGETAPIIVDPFAGESSSSAGGAIAADSIESGSGSSTDTDGSNGDGAASGDGGTSY